MTHDAWNLQRFVDAQDPLYDAVKLELGRGHKRTHWMWFVFPQLAALGSSATAKHYGLHSPAEAYAYLAHPVLGARLRECCDILLGVQGRTLHEIFVSPDDLKFRSCMTLFEIAAPQEPLFKKCLEKYCNGERDAVTQALCRPTS